MERLTKVYDKSGLLAYSISDTGLPTIITSGNPYHKLIKKLKLYEDTGLTPEEIMDGKMLTGWIPVEERIPETNRTVLIFAESTTIQGGTIMLAGACNNGYWFVQNGQNTLGFPCSKYNVVAWMPLPEPYNPVN